MSIACEGSLAIVIKVCLGRLLTVLRARRVWCERERWAIDKRKASSTPHYHEADPDVARECGLRQISSRELEADQYCELKWCSFGEYLGYTLGYDIWIEISTFFSQI